MLQSQAHHSPRAGTQHDSDEQQQQQQQRQRCEGEESDEHVVVLPMTLEELARSAVFAPDCTVERILPEATATFAQHILAKRHRLVALNSHAVSDSAELRALLLHNNSNGYGYGSSISSSISSSSSSSSSNGRTAGALPYNLDGVVDVTFARADVHARRVDIADSVLYDDVRSELASPSRERAGRMMVQQHRQQQQQQQQQQHKNKSYAAAAAAIMTTSPRRDTAAVQQPDRTCSLLRSSSPTSPSPPSSSSSASSSSTSMSLSEFDKVYISSPSAGTHVSQSASSSLAATGTTTATATAALYADAASLMLPEFDKMRLSARSSNDDDDNNNAAAAAVVAGGGGRSNDGDGGSRDCTHGQSTATHMPWRSPTSLLSQQQQHHYNSHEHPRRYSTQHEQQQQQHMLRRSSSDGVSLSPTPAQQQQQQQQQQQHYGGDMRVVSPASSSPSAMHTAATPTSATPDSGREGEMTVRTRLRRALEQVQPLHCVLCVVQDFNPIAEIELLALRERRRVVAADLAVKLRLRPRQAEFAQRLDDALRSGAWVVLVNAHKSMSACLALRDVLLEARARCAAAAAASQQQQQQHNNDGSSSSHGELCTSCGVDPNARIIVSLEPHPHFPRALIDGAVVLKFVSSFNGSAILSDSMATASQRARLVTAGAASTSHRGSGVALLSPSSMFAASPVSPTLAVTTSLSSSPQQQQLPLSLLLQQQQQPARPTRRRVRISAAVDIIDIPPRDVTRSPSTRAQRHQHGGSGSGSRRNEGEHDEHVQAPIDVSGSVVLTRVFRGVADDKFLCVRAVCDYARTNNNAHIRNSSSSSDSNDDEPDDDDEAVAATRRCAAAMASASGHVAVGSSLGNVYFLDSLGNALMQAHAHHAAIWDIAFADPFHLATGSEDGSAAMWRISADDKDDEASEQQTGCTPAAATTTMMGARAASAGAAAGAKSVVGGGGAAAAAAADENDASSAAALVQTSAVSLGSDVYCLAYLKNTRPSPLLVGGLHNHLLICHHNSSNGNNGTSSVEYGLTSSSSSRLPLGGNGDALSSPTVASAGLLLSSSSPVVVTTVPTPANVQVLDCLPSHSIALFGSGDGAIGVVDVQQGVLLRTLAHHTRKVPALTVRDDAHFFSGGFDSTILSWDVRTPHSTGAATIGAHTQHTLRLRNYVTGLSVDDVHLAAAVGENLYLWDVRNLNVVLGGYPQGWRGLTRGIVVHSSTHRVTTASQDGKMRFWVFV